jgi:hypothetical protein
LHPTREYPFTADNIASTNSLLCKFLILILFLVGACR